MTSGRTDVARCGGGSVVADGRIEAGAGAVQPALADVGQPLTSLPERNGLLEGGAARLELLNNGDELVARFLVAEVVIGSDGVIVGREVGGGGRLRLGHRASWLSRVSPS